MYIQQGNKGFAFVGSVHF